MKKSHYLTALFCALAAIVLYTTFPEHASSSTKPPTPIAEVAVLTMIPTTVTREQSLPGRITPIRQAQVRPQVDGIIIHRLFTEGTNVHKGQQLYQIDDARYKALFNSAQATLLSAQADEENTKVRVERFRELLKIKAISQQTFDDLLAEFNKFKAATAVAQANVDIAKVNLSYTKVYAPITGRISRSYVSEGALVTANQSQELALITQLDPIYVDLQQSDVNDTSLNTKIAKGSSFPVSLEFDYQGGIQHYSHEGHLQFSEVTMNESTASTVIRALIPNPEDQLLPGMFVRGKVSLGSEKVLLVPQRATIRTPEGTLKVWIADADNKAQPRHIDVDGTNGENWIVTRGLDSGDKLIVEGYQKVKPGEELKISIWSGTTIDKKTENLVTTKAHK